MHDLLGMIVFEIFRLVLSIGNCSRKKPRSFENIHVKIDGLDKMIKRENNFLLILLKNWPFQHLIIYAKGNSNLSNKRWVANKRRVWKKYQNLINKWSGTNRGHLIFVTLYKEVFKNSHFFHMFQWLFSKINKRRFFNNCLGPGTFSQKE